MTRAVMWFRDDLRLGDHPALAAATRNGVDGVLALYVVDETAWDRTNSPRRAYRRSSLKTLA
ncbi:MAG: deoxyribodipyrimidine photo-lyase, partial [Propionibacteriales bacterium]|nr:deoxyribodipyrimidine photo-lyase [Propionibacteriales bacterium]